MSHVTWAWAMTSMDALTHARWKVGSLARWIVPPPSAHAHTMALWSSRSSAHPSSFLKIG